MNECQWTMTKWTSYVVGLVLTLTLSSSPAQALDFGEVGVGTQVLVVPADDGTATGLGFDLRTRFLWVLGLGFSATNIQSNEAVWGVAAYRVGLMIHAVSTERFGLFLSPGLAGGSFGDAFNPFGGTTWYRLGGGLEVRVFEGMAIGLDLHWSVPGEKQIEDYIDENGEQLLASYLEGLGSSGEIPSSISELSTSALLREVPLDRFEWTIGLRYYF